MWDDVFTEGELNRLKEVKEARKLPNNPFSYSQNEGKCRFCLERILYLGLCRDHYFQYYHWKARGRNYIKQGKQHKNDLFQEYELWKKDVKRERERRKNEKKMAEG